MNAVDLREAFIKTLERLPTPQGCGCAKRKQKLIDALRGKDIDHASQRA
jgi:hypothetical protein